MYETQSRQQQSGRQDNGVKQNERIGGEQGQTAAGNFQHSLNIAELALRGSTVLFDIQLAAFRSLWQLQARSAAAFGAPDCSELLKLTDGSAKRLLSTGADQALSSARQASETIAELQRQFGRLVEQGTIQFSEEMRHGIEELNQRTQEGLQEVKNLAQQGADEAERLVKEREVEGRSRLESQSSQQQPSARPAHPSVEHPRPEDDREHAGKQRRSA